MAPSHMDYALTESQGNSKDSSIVGYTHKKFNTGCYKHKKFGKRVVKNESVATPTPLFRPYALSENTPRKRRQEQHHQQKQQQLQQPQQQHYQLPPTPPTTPPQQHQQQQQQLLQLRLQQQYVPTVTATPTPVINHQAYAYVLQKQRAALQMRQLLSINPDANTWPVELRNALYAILQQ